MFPPRPCVRSGASLLHGRRGSPTQYPFRQTASTLYFWTINAVALFVLMTALPDCREAYLARAACCDASNLYLRPHAEAREVCLQVGQNISTTVVRSIFRLPILQLSLYTYLIPTHVYMPGTLHLGRVKTLGQPCDLCVVLTLTCCPRQQSVPPQVLTVCCSTFCPSHHLTLPAKDLYCTLSRRIKTA